MISFKKYFVVILLFVSRLSLSQSIFHIDSIKITPPSAIGLCDATFTIHVSGGCGAYTYNFLTPSYNPSGGQCCGDYPFLLSDACGATISDTVKIPCNITTSVDNFHNINDIYLYPNPNRGSFDLSFTRRINQSFKIIVTDMVGEIIYNDNINGKNGFVSLNLSVKTGIYILTIKDVNTNEKVIKRLIIE